ncbi:MAG: hypothetical protein KKA73_25885 [Chloroflexi bacterium]|nr:hypothetical protein [Chloroflexota bacterium]MBU1751130.1 hypothetical protein [Chloroflexota bacterium]
MQPRSPTTIAPGNVARGRAAQYLDPCYGLQSCQPIDRQSLLVHLHPRYLQPCHAIHDSFQLAL